jgi:hypothetical protein
MSRSINIGHLTDAALRSLVGYRCLTKAGCAVNSTTNTYTITIGAKQTDDILTATITGAAGVVTKTHTVTAGNADNAAVATAFAAQIDAAADVAASAVGAVITVTAVATTTAFSISVAVTKETGSPTTTAAVAETIIGSKGVKTANTIQYVLDGHNGSQTTQTNIAIGGAVIPISSFRWYLLSINTDGTVTATPGENNANWLPEIPSNQTPIGAVKIATDATHTFTPGLTSLNGTGITDTYYDLSCVPKAGYPA